MPGSTANPVDMAEALAVYLAAHTATSWNVPYTTSTKWPTYIGPTMPARPLRLVCITPLEPVQVRATIELPVQLRIRGEQDAPARQVLDMADDIRAVLQHRSGMPLSQVQLATGIRVGAILPRGEKSLDDDARRSYEYVMNYRLRYRVGQRGASS